MELLNRTQAPDYKTIDEVRVPAVSSITMDNGQPLYWIKAGEQAVVRLECIYEAGSWYEHTPGASSLALKMLTEGTSSHSSAQISAYLDRYGAFLEQHSGADRASLTVYCLTKHLPEVAPLLHELLADSTIPEKELADNKNITLQNLRVSLEKNSYVAGLEIRKKVFGEQHPYGRSQSPETVESIQPEEVRAFYRQHIQQRPFRVILAGNVSETEVVLVNSVLGRQPVLPADMTHSEESRIGSADRQAVLIQKEGSLQSSIRMGRLMFNRRHPDYFPMLVLNEVLGGYFGSRLMKNIREEKGFTYGIWSNLAPFPRSGYLVIGTDVKREFTQLTIDEIRKEIGRLQQEPVAAQELDTVKNYMAGSFVGSLNTPFEIADRYKGILFDGLPTDYLSTYIDHIRAVRAEQVQEMAVRYLQHEDLTEVVVGGK